MKSDIAQHGYRAVISAYAEALDRADHRDEARMVRGVEAMFIVLNHVQDRATTEEKENIVVSMEAEMADGGWVDPLHTMTTESMDLEHKYESLVLMTLYNIMLADQNER